MTDPEARHDWHFATPQDSRPTCRGCGALGDEPREGETWPDLRLERCPMCLGTGWLPLLLDIRVTHVGNDWGGLDVEQRPVVGRATCAGCHGDGWVFPA